MIKKYILVFISISFLNILVSYTINISMLKLQTTMAFNVNFDIIEHLKKIPFLKIIKYDPVYLNQRINTDSNILITFLLNNFLNFFFNIITIIISFSILYSINITLAIILILLLPFYILSYMLLKNVLYKLSLKNKETQDKFFSALTEQITNIKSIKINSSFELYKTKAEKSFKDMFTNLVNFSKTSYFSSGLDNILSIIASSIVFFIGGLKIINNELSIGEFTIITTYFSKIVGTISYYLNIGKSFQNCKSSYYRIKELLDIPQEMNGNKFINNIKTINIENLSFKYDDRYLFLGFNYTFELGKIYCIKGSNGTGKSTLLNILIGLIYEHDNGMIKFNNINIKQLDMYKIRKEVFSIVPQDYTLKDLKLKNIIYKIKNSIKYINSLQYGEDLNAMLSFLNKVDLENNSDQFNTLSGGENQKLSIFNTFLKNTNIIIMDEPTSSLDEEGKDLLKRILLELKNDKLIILISHDNDIVDICDEVIELN